MFERQEALLSSRAQAHHAPPRITELPLEELSAILERARAAPLGESDHRKLSAAMETLTFLTAELQRKGASLERLRHLLFGPRTEKTEQVLGKGEPEPKGEAPAAPLGAEASAEQERKEKPKGHGRAGAAAYTGAEQVQVPHSSLHGGDACPGCEKGKVYPLSEPAKLVRITGMAPLGATVYACDRLRCNLCGEVFSAEAPPGVGEAKYDETATSMVALLKYGAGLPFNRIEKLQAGMGIPLPAATAWDLVEEAADVLAPLHQELLRQAAQGEVLHNDDTTMKILRVTQEEREAALGDDEQRRTGTFTSGIVGVRGDHRVALFFTGVKHAGENLAGVLAERAKDLPPPVQMCDALSRNSPGDFETILANCNAHARRNFVEVAESFPAECEKVLTAFREVYRVDKECKQRGLSAQERLAEHQRASGPVLRKLKRWAQAQLREKQVEPNSGLGQALSYLLEHWRKLTRFQKVPGAPLDNNLCERVLKKAILHRKNALFYKTLNGARVGDLYMSLIHTAELNGVGPFDYLVALQRHAAQVRERPGEWMPWNYQEACARLEQPAANDTPAST